MATRRTSTRGAATRGKTTRGKPPARTAQRTAGLEFNHAMIYTTQMEPALAFYRDRLGFALVDEYPGAYARLRSPGGRTTIALHALEPGKRMDASAEGLRLYFEVRNLDPFCRRLEACGVKLDQPPKDMPWGWRHAYLRDPDGHEISLYWAGARRFRKTTVGDGGDR